MAQAAAPDHPLTEVETVVRKFVEAGGDLAVNFVFAALILIVTIWASGSLSSFVRRVMVRAHRFGPPDTTLQSFVASLTRYIVLIVGLVAVLQQLGVQTTSIIAVLGAASLAIGLALQGALSNVAAGVMLLISRPYRVGDAIEAGGRQGVVRALDIFTTELATYDNVRVYIPNGKVFADVIVNMSAHATRRVDVICRVPYAFDPEAVIQHLMDAAHEDKRVLKEPPPLSETTNIMEAWIEIAVRLWVKRADYAGVRSDFYALARREMVAKKVTT